MKITLKRPILTGWAFLFFLFCGSLFTGETYAQNVERRLQALEQYVGTVGPAIQDISNTMQGTLQRYGEQLEVDLQNFSSSMQASVNRQLLDLDYTSAVLDINSKTFQRVDTNVGPFLMAISKSEPIDNGVRLHLNVGNIHNADFSNFEISFLWGNKFKSGDTESWENWRNSLNGARFSFKGTLKKGRWSPVSVDLVPANNRTIQYLECTMSVAAVELESW